MRLGIYETAVIIIINRKAGRNARYPGNKQPDPVSNTGARRLLSILRAYY